MALIIPANDSVAPIPAGDTPTRPANLTRQARRRRLARLETWRIGLSHTSDIRRYPLGRSFAEAAEAAIRLAGHGLCDMDILGACDSPPNLSSSRMVERSDVYVAIIGHNYGSVVPDRRDLSYTELEFETATKLGLPRLVFLVDGSDEKHQEPELRQRQQRFRRRLEEEAGLTVDHVATPERLETRLYHALASLKEEVRTAARSRR